MNAKTKLTHNLAIEGCTWDFYRIELFKASDDYRELLTYLRYNRIDFVEDINFGGSIIIFKIPRIGSKTLRDDIFTLFGDFPYFAMEGNVTLSESALYKCYRQILGEEL